jgi:GNAT superfamily N-acetyltransferase
LRGGAARDKNDGMSLPAPVADLSWTWDDGVRVTATSDPHSPVLRRFFDGYDRAFILPDEREEFDGFVQCLALNETHRNAYSRRHCEVAMAFEDADGVLLGGANFLAATTAGDAPAPATVALNYVYVEAAARGRGLLRRILADVRRTALSVLGLDPDGPAPVLFIEQNDPLRLTAEAYAADSDHSGLDQVDRLAIWARIGARVVDFPYVQPALSADQHPDDGLIYAAIGYPGDAVPAALLRDHLQSFFGISVLKGEAEAPGGPAAQQLAALAARADPVALLPMVPALARLAATPRPNFDFFRDLAREACRHGDQGTGA